MKHLRKFEMWTSDNSWKNPDAKKIKNDEVKPPTTGEKTESPKNPSGMVKLPKNVEKSNLIKDMKVGETGWTVPWAMEVDLDGNCLLDSEFEFFRNPAGTCQLQIEKTKDGFIADVNNLIAIWANRPGKEKGDYTWKKRSIINKSKFFPVIGFEINNKPVETSLEDDLIKGLPTFGMQVALPPLDYRYAGQGPYKSG